MKYALIVVALLTMAIAIPADSKRACASGHTHGSGYLLLQRPLAVACVVRM